MGGGTEGEEKTCTLFFKKTLVCLSVHCIKGRARTGLLLEITFSISSLQLNNLFIMLTMPNRTRGADKWDSTAIQGNKRDVKYSFE